MDEKEMDIIDSIFSLDLDLQPESPKSPEWSLRRQWSTESELKTPTNHPDLSFNPDSTGFITFKLIGGKMSVHCSTFDRFPNSMLYEFVHSKHAYAGSIGEITLERSIEEFKTVCEFYTNKKFKLTKFLGYDWYDSINSNISKFYRLPELGALYVHCVMCGADCVKNVKYRGKCKPKYGISLPGGTHGFSTEYNRVFSSLGFSWGLFKSICLPNFMLRYLDDPPLIFFSNYTGNKNSDYFWPVRKIMHRSGSNFLNISKLRNGSWILIFYENFYRGGDGCNFISFILPTKNWHQRDLVSSWKRFNGRLSNSVFYDSVYFLSFQINFKPIYTSLGYRLCNEMPKELQQIIFSFAHDWHTNSYNSRCGSLSACNELRLVCKSFSRVKCLPYHLIIDRIDLREFVSHVMELDSFTCQSVSIITIATNNESFNDSQVDLFGDLLIALLDKLHAVERIHFEFSQVFEPFRSDSSLYPSSLLERVFKLRKWKEIRCYNILSSLNLYALPILKHSLTTLTSLSLLHLKLDTVKFITPLINLQRLEICISTDTPLPLRIRADDICELKSLENLRWLYINIAGDLPLEENGPGIFNSKEWFNYLSFMPKLQSLVYSGDKYLFNEDCVCFLRNKAYLSFISVRLTDAALVAVCSLGLSIEILDIDIAELSDEGFSNFFKLDKLKLLRLRVFTPVIRLTKYCFSSFKHMQIKLVLESRENLFDRLLGYLHETFSQVIPMSVLEELGFCCYYICNYTIKSYSWDSYELLNFYMDRDVLSIK